MLRSVALGCLKKVTAPQTSGDFYTFLVLGGIAEALVTTSTSSNIYKKAPSGNLIYVRGRMDDRDSSLANFWLNGNQMVESQNEEFGHTSGFILSEKTCRAYLSAPGMLVLDFLEYIQDQGIGREREREWKRARSQSLFSLLCRGLREICGQDIISIIRSKKTDNEIIAACRFALLYQVGSFGNRLEAAKKAVVEPKDSFNVYMLDSDTWNTVGQTRAVRRKLQQLRVTWTKAMKFEIFYAWKVSSRKRPVCRAWLKRHDFETACALQELFRIRQARCKSLQAGEAAFLDKCARRSHDELNEAKGTDLWKMIRYSLPKYRRRRHQVLPFESTQEAFLHHFASIEDATLQTEDELRQFSRAHSSSAIAAAIQMQVASADLPSVYELEDAIRELQVGRSSIRCLPAEFLRADPAASATLLFPSLLALFRFFQQPMSWKGGQYFPLFKGKGSSATPAGYRAILIGNAIPKVFHPGTG